jgi:hypothetical protein
MEAGRFVRCRCSLIFWKVGLQMAVGFSALRTGRPPFTLRNVPDTQKVACSIPDYIVQFLNLPITFGRTVSLGDYSATNTNEYQESSRG